MRLTTKTDYAVIILLELANHPRIPVSLPAIAKNSGVSKIYLQRIAAGLKKAKIIKSKHGAHGGYFLNKPAVKISLAEIITATGDELASVRCLKKNIECPFQHKCPGNRGWQRFQAKFNQLFTKTFLKDLQTPREKK